MKRTVSIALLLVMCVSVAFAQEAGSLRDLVTEWSVDPIYDVTGLVDEGAELTVASHTEMAGFFGLDMWGNNTADIDVRYLLHGYNTVAWVTSMETMFNGMVVESVVLSTDRVGNQTYTFEISKDLTYNDGSPITAKDYLFSLLMSASPEILELGGHPRGLRHFLGYGDYEAGLTKGIQGIRLLSDYSYSLTIDGSFLPYFFGLVLLEISPYPMRVIAPGCDILDDGDGAYIGKGADAASMNAAALGFEPGVYNATMLAKTLLDPSTGYLFNPKVTSGPYQLEWYNNETKAAMFLLNPRFKGNFEGQRPNIDHILFKYIDNEDMAEALESGEVGLLNKAMDGPTIDSLLELMRNWPAVRVSNYPREGLAYLAFACEAGVTADVAVRRAIALAIPKDDLLAELSHYALPVHGYYGLGQWIMSFVSEGDPARGFEAVSTAADMEDMKVSYDLEAAKTLLTRSGWAYGADGAPYEGGFRYRKEEDGSLTPLVIRWAKPIDSAQAVDLIQAYLEAAFAAAGIGLEVTEMLFTDLLPYFYRAVPRVDFDMFFLGSNFLDVYDPFYDYHTADMYQGTVNTSGLRDEVLMTLAWNMRSTQQAAKLEYAHKWLVFQKRWLEMMPLIPLYSNIYFDFYTDRLQGYDVMRSRSWALTIQYAWIGEPLPVEVEAVELLFE